MADENIESTKTEPLANPAQAATVSNPIKKSASKAPLIVIVIVAIFFAIGGFIAWRFISNKVADKTAETLVEKTLGASTGTKVDVNSNKDTVTVKNADGESVSYSSNAKLSDDFPKAIPLYPGQVINGNIRTKADDGTVSWIVTATSSDSVAKITTYLKDKLAGWEASSEYNMNDSYTASYKKDKTELSLIISPDSSDKTKVTIMYTVSVKP